MSFIDEYLRKRQERYANTNYAQVIEDTPEPTQTDIAQPEQNMSTTEIPSVRQQEDELVSVSEPAGSMQGEEYTPTEPSRRSEQQVEQRQPVVYEQVQLPDLSPAEPVQQTSWSPSEPVVQGGDILDPSENYKRMIKSNPTLDEVGKFLKLDEGRRQQDFVQYQEGTGFHGYIESSYKSISEEMRSKNESDMRDVLAAIARPSSSENAINIGMRGQL